MTIGSGITIHGQTGYVGYNPNVSYEYNNVFINQGLIETDVAGGEITLQGALQNGYVWSNSGTLQAGSGATLRLMGNFTNTGSIAAQGATILLGDVNGYGGTTFTLGPSSTYNIVSSTVEVEGTLINAGSTLTLNSTTGSWIVNQGTILGGTITTANGAVLLGDNVLTNPGLLDGVTLAGTLDLTKSASGGIGFTDGLTLAGGTILIGSPGDTGNFGVLTNYGGSGPTLGGLGTVIFGGSPSDTIQTGASLTFGSGILIHGQDGFVGYNPNYSIAPNNTFTNLGAIDADVAGGEITLQGALNSGYSWSNVGTLRRQWGHAAANG